MVEFEDQMPPEPETGPPDGPVNFAWFGGILDGRRGDDDRLHQAVQRGNALGLVHLDLELDGGRFSVLFDGKAVPGHQMTSERTAGLIEVLEEVVASSSEPFGVESTLRCTEVYETGAVDTLFAASEGQVEPVSRPRSLSEEDHRHAPRQAIAPVRLNMPRRQALGLMALVMVAFGLLAWQQGLVGLVAGTKAEALKVSTQPFGDSLAVEVTPKLGRYEVTVSRGPGWPLDEAALQAQIDAAESLTAAAALRAIGDGSVVYLLLKDSEGKVLESVSVELAPLIELDLKIQRDLRRRWGAEQVTLSLSSGRDA